MKTIAKGAKGPEVGLLRRLLNQTLKPSPGLPEANIFGPRYNGAVATIDFGPRMDQAVRTFQRGKRLRDDGIVGPKTWGALGLAMDINRRVNLHAQPSNDTCYAAAATMALGSYAASMSVGIGAAPAGLRPDDHWAREYSRLFNWKLEYGQTPTPKLLSLLMWTGPVWVAGNFPFPSGPSYHAVVIASMWGTGDPDSTMLLIYDPWPVNAGEVYGVILGDWLWNNPEAFRYMLHR